MKLTFKKITVDEWQELKRLEEASANEMFAPCEGEEGFKKYITNSTVYFIVNENGETVGTISYKDEGEVTTINGLTVMPEYRKQGIAKAAMQQLLDEIGEATVALTVHPANTPALFIYLRLGFTITAWKDNYFGDGEPRLYLVKEMK